MNLYGSWRTDDSYTALELGIFPCASRIENYDGSSVSGGHDDCEWNQRSVEEYLELAPSMLILYNQVEFNDRKFGDERVVKKSKLHTQTI